MSSKAALLRRRAESNPRDLADETDEIKDCLDAAYYDERRHAINAARKVAYVAPEAMRNCIPELADIAASGRSTSIREDACRTLGHIGRVDGRAVDALAEQQRTATDREVRSTAATARNSLARAPVPESADTGNESDNTDVFPPSSSGTDTDVYGSDDDSDTDNDGPDDDSHTDVYKSGGTEESDADVHDAEPAGAETPGDSDVPNFCQHCGTDLREITGPNFCPHCGTDV